MNKKKFIKRENGKRLKIETHIHAHNMNDYGTI